MRTKRKQPASAGYSAMKARRQTSSIVGNLLIMLAVVAAVVFGVAIFFKVNTIEVQGNSVYSAQQVIDASQIEIGDNLLTVNRAAAAGRIRAKLAYVEEVSIGRSLPDGIIIQIRENEIAFAAVSTTNTVWLVSPGGKALERTDGAALERYPTIEGVLIDTPVLGSTVTSPSQSQLNAVLQIMEQLDGTGILDHIASINVEREYDIVVWYDDRYEIKLGGTDQIEYKIRYLCSILDSLSEYQAGTIDLTRAAEKKATFTPRD